MDTQGERERGKRGNEPYPKSHRDSDKKETHTDIHSQRDSLLNRYTFSSGHTPTYEMMYGEVGCVEIGENITVVLEVRCSVLINRKIKEISLLL